MEKQLTDNFRLSEFVCKCGCGADDIDLRLVNTVQTILTLYGKPIYITSGSSVRLTTEALRLLVWKTVPTSQARQWISVGQTQLMATG